MFTDVCACVCVVVCLCVCTFRGPQVRSLREESSTKARPAGCPGEEEEKKGIQNRRQRCRGRGEGGGRTREEVKIAEGERE